MKFSMTAWASDWVGRSCICDVKFAFVMEDLDVWTDGQVQYTVIPHFDTHGCHPALKGLTPLLGLVLRLS